MDSYYPEAVKRLLGLGKLSMLITRTEALPAMTSLSLIAKGGGSYGTS